MKTRKLALGDRNLIGMRVTELRNERGMKQIELLAQLQVRGVDISVPALSLPEGQKRPVSDIELAALAKIFGVTADFLLGRSSLFSIQPRNLHRYRAGLRALFLISD